MPDRKGDARSGIRDKILRKKTERIKTENNIIRSCKKITVMNKDCDKAEVRSVKKIFISDKLR